jgi:acyl-coenzyme A synthetase/AMP-(fatty) acid ligase
VADCRVVLAEAGTPRLHAFVVAGGGFDELELRRHLATTVSNYKIPSVIRPVDALPRTPTGKVRMADLRRMAGSEP